MITADQIQRKAANAYPRVLAAWMGGELDELFPLPLRASLSLIKGDLPATMKAVDALRSGAKEKRGWGYTVHWRNKRERDFGRNEYPDRITIDTLDDLLRLARRRRDFVATCKVANRLREEFPALANWLASNIGKLSRLGEPLEGLVDVTRFFLNHPRPDCYARQIPVAVDTKFVQRHHLVIWAWLNALLPASAIEVNETQNFALRFGLRDGQPHRAIRVLDPVLQAELGLPFAECSLPPRFLATLPVRNAIAIIVENQLNLLTLPPMPRGIGICGKGAAVTQLDKLEWLHQNRVIYWGDIDIEGFQILSSLRNIFPQVDSIMMDRATLNQHSHYIVQGNAPRCAEPPRLTDEERACYVQCSEHRQRLEQERVLQEYVDWVVDILFSSPGC